MRDLAGSTVRVLGHARRRKLLLAGFVAATTIVAAGCTSSGRTSSADNPGSTKESTAIPQPDLPGDIPVAPDSKRVDLQVPRFSNPTKVTNPLFPVSRQASVLFVGHVDGKPFRTEVTLLPHTRVIDWGGQRVETLVSQYAAYLDGRLQEVAYDLYAQADAGSVWYFGEDVADLEKGAIFTKEGTWLAGKDGPAEMIMPGNPKIGDVFRTENIPGIAFEEVTVTSVTKKLEGPVGPIEGGMVGQELHMDGATEDKLFAPGYGEFYTRSGADVEALALAVPTNALTGGVPAELTAQQSGANRVFDAAKSRDWPAASASVDEMKAAWAHFRAGEVPRLIEPWMTRALDSLAKNVDSHHAARARQAAIDVARWSLDLQLRYRPPAEVDLARFDLWAAQLQFDAAAHDAPAVNGDVFTLFYIRDRILDSLTPADVTKVNSLIGRLQVAGVEKDLAAAVKAAAGVREFVAGLQAMSR
jgi:hypothetical protein